MWNSSYYMLLVETTALLTCLMQGMYKRQLNSAVISSLPKSNELISFLRDVHISHPRKEHFFIILWRNLSTSSYNSCFYLFHTCETVLDKTSCPTEEKNSFLLQTVLLVETTALYICSLLWELQNRRHFLHALCKACISFTHLDKTSCPMPRRNLLGRVIALLKEQADVFHI